MTDRKNHSTIEAHGKEKDFDDSVDTPMNKTNYGQPKFTNDERKSSAGSMRMAMQYNYSPSNVMAKRRIRSQNKNTASMKMHK